MSPTPPNPFSGVLGGGEETRAHISYFFDNSGRGDADSLVVQRSCSGALFFEDPQARRPVPAGHAMLFTHREDTRYGYPPEAREPCRLRFLAVSQHGVRDLFNRLRHDFGPVVRMPDQSEATLLFDDILDRYDRRTFEDRFHEADLIHRMLVALYREQVAATRHHDPVEFGYHYVRSRFRSPINLKQVAADCGVSREHFIRMFSARHGEPPGEMLRRLRLEHAHTMLCATEIPIQDVALACGFASATAFCRAYRLKFGVSPGSIRKT